MSLATQKYQAIACIAVVSRVIVWIISQSADRLAADYDTSSGLQPLECSSVDVQSVARVKDLWFRSKIVWDSVFFSRIALCGYEYEQYYAFFPLLPGLLKMGMKAVQAVNQSLPPAAALALAAAFLSFAAFVTSAVYLHKLSVDILRDHRLADLATLMYIWNPASVFYSAAYTESMFACGAFVGLYYLNRRPWLSTVFFSAASAARSNGILHGWFMLHNLARVLLHPGRPDQGTHAVLVVALQSVLICLPAIAFQYVGWQSFCSSDASARPWCSAKLPNIYSFVQSHYWGVGLFRYFSVQQIPNFLLAMPILSLSCAGCWEYFSCNWARALLLGVCDAPPKQLLTVMRSWKTKSLQTEKHGLATAGTGFSSSPVAPYIYQWALMTACALLVMNVQVATRFLSACPALYWYIASLHNSKGYRWVWAYFMAYFCLGSILFPNFYPWT